MRLPSCYEILYSLHLYDYFSWLSSKTHICKWQTKQTQLTESLNFIENKQSQKSPKIDNRQFGKISSFKK